MAKKIESIQVINAEKRRIPSKHYVRYIFVNYNKTSDFQTVTLLNKKVKNSKM